jgi:hypothetical protein
MPTFSTHGILLVWGAILTQSTENFLFQQVQGTGISASILRTTTADGAKANWTPCRKRFTSRRIGRRRLFSRRAGALPQTRDFLMHGNKAFCGREGGLVS